MTEEERPRDLVSGSGRPIEPKAFQQMVSLRLDGGVVAALRAYARETGRSLSDVLREAATNYLRDVQAAHSVTLHYTVTNRTRSASDAPREFETVVPPPGLLAETA